MTNQKLPSKIDSSKVNEMIRTGDFSPAQGQASAFISTLLHAAPELMKVALSAALENAQVTREINEYINDTSKLAVEKQSSIAQSEIDSIGTINIKLAETLLPLSKKQDKTPEEIQLYFETLRLVEQGNSQMADSRKQSQRFNEGAQVRVIEATKNKDSLGKLFLKHLIDSPEAMAQAGKLALEFVELIHLYKKG